MPYTRRALGRLALAGLPARLALPAAARRQQASPVGAGSRWCGVQIGVSVPSGVGSVAPTPQDIVGICSAIGVDAVELDAEAVETSLGVPVIPACSIPLADNGLELGLHPLEEEILQDEVDLARRTFEEQRRLWRSSVSPATLDTLRREYENAGVRVESLEWSGLTFLSDDEVDYGFRVAAALGARAVSTGLVPGGPRRLGSFADRHLIRIGFRGGPTTGAEELEAALAHGNLTAVSIDIGDWIAGGHGSPLPFLEQHAARITHVRLKVGITAGDTGTPFGRADPIVRGVLQEMRTRQWPFQATLVMSDDPDLSRRISAVVKAVGFCRTCLTA